MGLRNTSAFGLFLLGSATQAMAHEERAPLSSNPIDWLLPGLAYVLPGLLVAVLLNAYASRLHFIVRVMLAIVFPMFFWLVFLYFLWLPDSSFLTFLLRLPYLIFDRAIILLLVPSSMVIAGLGLLDDRRRLKARHAEVFATDI